MGQAPPPLTPEELVAVVAAVELVWPAPSPVPDASSAPPAGSWRFSGRWWNQGG